MHTGNEVIPVMHSPGTNGERVHGTGLGSGWVRVGLWSALALALLAHLYGLYMPVESGASEWFPHSDKLLHLLGFGIPSTLALLTFRHWWPLAAFAVHAVVSEIVQALLLPGRDGDVWDLAADLIGVLGALVAWRFWRSRRFAVGAGHSTRAGRRLARHRSTSPS